MLAGILRHVGVLDDTLQKSSDTGCRCLEFVCCILRELLLDAQLLLLRMVKLPVEHDDGV